MLYVEILCVTDALDSREGYVYSFVGNAGRGSSIFFLCIHEERHKFLNGRHWNITSVVPCEQSFAFEV